MFDRRMALVLALATLAPLGAGTAQAMIALAGDVAPVHDPVVIKEKGVYYLFFHASFGEGRGRGSPLQISTLGWEDGWPKAGGLAMSRRPPPAIES